MLELLDEERVDEVELEELESVLDVELLLLIVDEELDEIVDELESVEDVDELESVELVELDDETSVSLRPRTYSEKVTLAVTADTFTRQFEAGVTGIPSSSGLCSR